MLMKDYTLCTRPKNYTIQCVRHDFMPHTLSDRCIHIQRRRAIHHVHLMNSRCCRFVLRFALGQREALTDKNKIHAQIVTEKK